MKRNLAILIAPLLMIWLNAWGFQGHGFKILSEKLELSSKTHDGFFKKTKHGKMLNQKSISVLAKAYDVEGKAGQNTTLNGMHSFYINNTSKETKTYYCKYELFCNKYYVRKKIQIEVKPGGSVSDESESFLVSYFPEPGSFEIKSMTAVNDDVSEDTATLNIK